MFAEICRQIRNSVYGFNGMTYVAPQKVSCTVGTAFMIAPGILVTAAHLVHVDNDVRKPLHSTFEIIRAPDVGQSMGTGELINNDTARDLALIRVTNPNSNDCVRLRKERILVGTRCGSLGFPLASLSMTPEGKIYTLTERFQGAYISSFYTMPDSQGQELNVYETDTLMYEGSSGCPGFTEDGIVFGMHVGSLMANPKKISDPETRIAISIWLPSMDIINYARQNGIQC